ncbi:carboxypeptidase-like regulatory domain-containing protein [Kribbella sp. WER1]
MNTWFELVADWVDGRLDPERADAVEATVANVPATAAAASWLRRFKRAAAELPLEEPPPIVAQRLHQYFERWRTGRESGQLPELRAEQVFDSRRDLVLVGLRAAGSVEHAIHVAFRSARADLVVDIHRLGRGNSRIDGQLLVEPGAAPVAEVTLRGGAGEFRSVDGDELGRFCLPDVPDGQYELRASNGEFVVVADVTIEPDRPLAGSGTEPS